MPITQERQTIQDLRSVGFSEEQAILLAAKLEAAAQATAQDLKAFISTEIERLRADLEVRLAQMEARFERSLRVFLVAILTTFVGVTALAVAIIKLVP